MQEAKFKLARGKGQIANLPICQLANLQFAYYSLKMNHEFRQIGIVVQMHFLAQAVAFVFHTPY